MLRLLFLTTWDFSDGPSTGITNKIKAQIKAFEISGFKVDYTYIADDAVYYHKDGQNIRLGTVGKFRKLAGFYYLYKTLKKENYEYVYNRYALMDPYYYKLLKVFKKKESKIVVEMPTFPYDKERRPGVAWGFLFFLDKVYRNNLPKVADVIATYSEHKEIFGVKAIRIHNGIDFDRVLLRNPRNKTDEIHLLAVAGLARWHGYDRLLRGMGKYYQTDGSRKVYFHIVGDGPVRGEYEQIIEQYGLQEYCFMEGVKKGEELNEFYDMCDIGIECLASFRKDIFVSSSLKSREYVAKGIPFVTASKSDVFENKDFVLKVSEDETDIDIRNIISFYDHMYAGRGRKY